MSSLLLISVMEEVTKTIKADSTWKILNADDIVLPDESIMSLLQSHQHEKKSGGLETGN